MSPLAWLRQSSLTLKLYMLGVAGFTASLGMYNLLLNLHLLELGFRAASIGTVSLVASMVVGFAAVPAGLVADRIGARRVLIGGSLLWACGFAALPWSPNFTYIICLVFLANLGQGAIMGSEIPTALANIAPSERPAMLSVFWSIYPLGQAVGALVIGQLLRVIPHGPHSSYQYPLAIAACVALMTAVLRLCLPLKLHARDRATPTTNLRSLLPTPPMLKVGATSMLVGASVALTLNFLNLLLKTRFILPGTTISLIIGLTTLICLFGPAPATFLMRRLGLARAATVVMAAATVLLVGAGFSPILAVFLVPVILREILHYTQFPLIDTIGTQAVPSSRHASLISYRKFGSFVGMALMARPYSVLIGAGHFQAAFLVAGLLAAAAGVCYYLFFGRAKQVLAPADSTGAPMLGQVAATEEPATLE